MRFSLVPLFLLGSLWAQTVTIQKSNTDENFRGVSTAGKNVAWASGTHGTYLCTVDAGKFWQVSKVPGAEGLDFRDVEAFSANIAYLLSAGPGAQSRIYKTTDAGRNWELQFTNKDAKGFFDCMAFWNPDHGIALGDPVDGKFVVILTDDGGKHWTAIPPGALPPAIEGEGAFAASGSCITVHGRANVWFATGGKAARVFHSADSGKSWTVAETSILHGDDSTGIFSIAFRDARHGVIAGGDYKHPGQAGPNLAFTEDGGRSWKASRASPPAYFSAVAFEPKNDGILAVGPSLALEIRGAEAHKISDLNLNALSIRPSGQALAVGPKGLVVSFDHMHRSKPQ